MKRDVGFLLRSFPRLLAVVAVLGVVSAPSGAVASDPCYLATGVNLVDLTDDLIASSDDGETDDVRVEIGAGYACRVFSVLGGDLTFDVGLFASEATQVQFADDPVYRVGPGVGTTIVEAFSVIGVGMWKTHESFLDYNEYEFRVFLSKDLESLIDTFGGWFSDGFQAGINEGTPR